MREVQLDIMETLWNFCNHVILMFPTDKKYIVW